MFKKTLLIKHLLTPINRTREVLIKLIAIVLLSLFSLKSFAQTKVAVVKLMRGQATASLGGKVTEIKLGDWLSSGSIVKTADQSFVKLIFVDKSNINVGPNSQMIIEKFAGDEPGVIKRVIQHAYRFDRIVQRV